MFEKRSLRPNGTPTEPNGNDPLSVPPATVGPDVYNPGDPNGVEIAASASGSWNPPSRIVPSHWSGYPSEWATPLWGTLERLSDTAWTCLDLNSSVFASMPPYLVGASPNLAQEWLTNPSPDFYSSWVDFARQMFWDFELGEVFIIATARYATGFPARFHVVPPWTVEVDFDSLGLRRYRIGNLMIPRDDVLHVRYQSTTKDARGTGPLDVGRSRMVSASVLNRYATDFALGGGVPSSILTHPDELTADQSNLLLDQWITARMSRMGLPAVISGGVEWKATGSNPLESAMVDLAGFQESRIAVLLGVPPFLVGLPSGGDSMTYSNVTSLFDYHWRAGLRPKATRLMAALSNWLVPRGTAIEVNRDEYVRPGPLERAQTWEILTRIGVLTPEQVQEIERYSIAGPTLSPSLSSGVLQ